MKAVLVAFVFYDAMRVLSRLSPSRRSNFLQKFLVFFLVLKGLGSVFTVCVREKFVKVVKYSLAFQVEGSRELPRLVKQSLNSPL